MKENLTLKKDFRGLDAGTELVYSPALVSWVYESVQEEISDMGHESTKVRVQFSDSYVRNHPDVFEYPDQESIEEKEKQERISNLQNLVNKALKEIEILKKQ